MTNFSDKVAPSAKPANWKNEGGAPGRPQRDKVISWFVPPIIVPAFLVALIVARAAYLAFLD
jgi:hypothetical protein